MTSTGVALRLYLCNGLWLSCKSCHVLRVTVTRCVTSSASKRSIRRFVITENAPTRAFFWLKAATIACTFNPFKTDFSLTFKKKLNTYSYFMYQ